jgi:hypothetical protein
MVVVVNIEEEIDGCSVPQLSRHKQVVLQILSLAAAMKNNIFC